MAFEYNDDYYDDEEDEKEEEEDEEEEEEEQESEEEKKKKELEEKILKNKLKAIFTKVSKGSATKLNATDKKTVKDAKKHENLAKDIKKINMVLAINKVKKTMKMMSSSPAFFYVFMGILIIFLIICVVAIVGSMMPWLFPDDENSKNGASAMFGITGKDFYGARMVYTDDDLAAKSIIEDYVELVENGISEAESITSATASASGESLSVVLTVNIELPNEEYDYSQFNETTFMSEYGVLYSTVYEIAKIVYKADNGTDFAGGSLTDCVNGILYFGYGDMTEISNYLIPVIVQNSTFVSSNDTEGKLDQVNDINPLIENKLTTLYGNTKYSTRTEKLFVKDYILTGEDDMMKNISQQNYIAFIFMPKKNVNFTKFSFSVGNADLTNFEIELTNNGDKVNISKDDFDFSIEENSSKQSYIYSSGLFTNESAGVFTDIDTNNLSALAEGLSLFDIVDSVDNYSTYLETKTDANSVQYLTIKQNGVVVSLSNTEAFSFVEFETKWNAS